jgi:hypothetical protein
MLAGREWRRTGSGPKLAVDGLAACAYGNSRGELADGLLGPSGIRRRASSIGTGNSQASVGERRPGALCDRRCERREARRLRARAAQPGAGAPVSKGASRARAKESRPRVCPLSATMKVTVKRWAAIAQWRWDIGAARGADGDDADEEDVCGICRVAYEACCPACKLPGDDCPLSCAPARAPWR